METNARDLDGVLVVSLEQAVAAPYATCRMADAGARVIKLERREGDFARGYDAYVNGASAYFVWLNHGKESVFFDLKDPADVALLHRMLAGADVFVQNLAPGATERAGIGSATLRERYPRLITCDISGYGASGPYRDMKAYDLLVQAESGLAYLSGTPESPGRVGVSVCDIACGMSAYQEVLRALYARSRSGVGRAVEVSLYGSIADWMNVPYLQHRYGGHVPARLGLQHPTIAPYGAYPCGDGRTVLLAIQNEREWRRFCETVLGDAALANDPRFTSNGLRVEHRAALDAAIGATFAELSRDDVAERLRNAEIAFGRLSSVEDLAVHPQNRFVEVEAGGGTVELLAPPGAGPSHLGSVPELGAHDAAVRAEFGG
jgi:itaconate CoA-transferase